VDRPASGLSLTRSTYAPDTVQPAHHHAFASLTVVLAGSLAETVAGHTEVAGPLSVVAKPPFLAHADRMGPRGARTLRLSLAEEEHRALVRAGAPLGGWRWFHSGPIARELLRLAAAARPAHADAFPEEAHDALARLCAPLPPSRVPPRWLARVRESIDDRIGRALRVRDLASEAGVHPVYLARRFRRHFGCSVVEYIRWRRAREAAALIGGSGLSLSDVAQRAGFSDHAHLSRDFKRLTGVSPRTFRGHARVTALPCDTRQTVPRAGRPGPGPSMLPAWSITSIG
jgi:AraC family transcriptional regulator